MDRRTKIVCTLGPASNSREIIRALIGAGMDVARLNFSHGTHERHSRVIEYVREAAADAGKVVPILQDLQGPKIRIGQVRNEEVMLEVGQKLTLTNIPLENSDSERVYINYPSLTQDLDFDSSILIDDGQLELRVLERRDSELNVEVVVGGPLRSRKGVNLPHIRTTTPSMTEKDLEDLAFGIEMEVDLIALSFVRDEADVMDLIRRVRSSGKRISVIAKIEKPEAVSRIDQIISKADGIMVARGDLGIEMRLSKVPGTQKRIIKKCRGAAKPVITATQMLESMIEHPRPTRAEVSDVANAVLDGSDAVMLSGETAVGRDPVRVVEVMGRIIAEAERDYDYGASSVAQQLTTFDITEAVSHNAYELAGEVGAVAIACLTASGATARSIARHRPPVPV
jgi:pyruvate kinase